MKHLAAVLLLLSLTGMASAQTTKADAPKPACISIDKAKDFVGREVCVSGRVYHVGFTDSGTAMLGFCEERKGCLFSVVVFERDLEAVGNVQMFEGRMLEVTGKVRDYKGTAEIVVKRRSQFSGEAVSPVANPGSRTRSERWHR